MAPNENPPMCAQKATPPLTLTREVSEPTPLNSCSTNHRPSTTNAGRYTAVIRKKNTKVRTRLLGNINRYAPRTPAMAPDAPRFGMTEFGATASWASEATIPLTR